VASSVTLASGSLRALARWPVKSLGGEVLHRAEVDHRGISGDRRYTVSDPTRGSSGPLDAANTPALLRWTATGAPVPVLRDAGGRAWNADDPSAAAALGADLGRPVVLGRHTVGQQYIPGSVLVTVEGSRLALERELGHVIDLRRFRTNLHLELDTQPFAEHAWEGDLLRVGAATFDLLHPCERCVIAARDPLTGSKWPGLLRHLHREHDQLFGMLARPRSPATVNVGDQVQVIQNGC
jgi:MOSC domain-containing protein